jgi:dihydrofolate reductase
MTDISIIAAHDDKKGIGKNNQLPWHLSKDFKHFKKLTLNHPVIMGRKTFDSIGKPLPNRLNIIISRNKKYSPQHSTPEWNVLTTDSVAKAIKLAQKKDKQEVFIIGGGEIYAQALPLATKLYLTHVKGDFNCDTFFPDYQAFNHLISKESHHETDLNFSFITLTKS